MSDRKEAEKLYLEMRQLVFPMCEGKPAHVVNAAFSELMVDVALVGRSDKTRAQAMEMLAKTMVRTAEMMRAGVEVENKRLKH